MAIDFAISATDLRRFIFGLSGSDLKIVSMSGRYLKKMTKYTQKKMKQYARSKKARASGNLSDSISSKYTISDDILASEVFVPKSVKYQFAAEYGISRRQKIYGRPKMTFPAEHWSKSKRTTLKVPHRGYFVFTQVTRGRYKGRFYTQRAYKDLQKFYNSNVKDKMPTDLIRILSFGR